MPGSSVVAILTAAVVFAAAPSQSQELPAQPVYGNITLERGDLQILTAGTILSLMALSTESSEAAQNNLDGISVLDAPMDVGNAYGSTWTVATMTLAMGAYGLLGDSPRFKGAALDLTRSLAVTGGLVGALKWSVNRKRPNGGGHSFPSGHTAVAFTAAPVIATYFGPRCGALAYGLATLTALGRMEDNKHYFSDVIAGAAVGTIVSRVITRHGSRYSLFAGPGGVGLNYEF